MATSTSAETLVNVTAIQLGGSQIYSPPTGRYALIDVLTLNNSGGDVIAVGALPPVGGTNRPYSFTLPPGETISVPAGSSFSGVAREFANP